MFAKRLRLFPQSVQLFALFTAILFLTVEGTSAQTIAGYAIGENRSRLEEHGRIAWEYGYGEYTNGTFSLQNGTKLSSTSETSTGKLVRLEAGWTDKGRPQLAYFSDFRFGQTTLADVRGRLGSSGALPGRGSPVLTATDGGVTISSFYEVAGSEVIAVFTTKVSRASLIDLQRRYGSDVYAHVASAAMLDSVVIWDAAYFRSVRGAPYTFDTGYRPIVWQPTVSQPAEAKRAISLARIKPSQLPVARVYFGPNNLPDFSSQSATFRNFRTRISDGMAAGPTFAGEFAVIQIGCGTSCSNAFLGNVRTGELFQLPVGGENNMNLALKYDLSSRLMTAQWSDADTGKCFIQFFSFDDGEWIELLKQDIGASEKCLTSASQNLR
ncbi:hypothetical protein [Rhizobium wenxiniae]|uniref:hypothetical protein n=1 Tax=Rhizobium wenxiniae TaxID=1737357 RepID=UPI003C20B956